MTMVSHFLFFFFFWLVSISPHSHKIELFDSSGDHNNPSSSSSFFQHLPLRSSSSSILMSPEFCSIKIEDEIADLTKFGTASKTIGRDTYVVKLCEKIQDIMGCEGSHVCKESLGKGISLGSSEVAPTAHGSIFLTNGTIGCGGVVRTTEIFALCHPSKAAVVILDVEETSPCEHQIIIGRPCNGNCKLKLWKSFGERDCILGKTYGCLPGGDKNGMWVRSSCKGGFTCNRKIVRCMASEGEYVECPC